MPTCARTFGPGTTWVRGINIYTIFLFGGDLVGSFFPSRPQYAILGIGILGQIASSERRRRGSAQSPLALPYPFRIWPGSGTWAERNKRKVRNFLYFGRYTPELFLELGIFLQSLNKKNTNMGKHFFQVGIISKLASYFVPITLFHGHTSKRLAFCAHRTTDYCVVAFRYRISRLGHFLYSRICQSKTAFFD